MGRKALGENIQLGVGVLLLPHKYMYVRPLSLRGLLLKLPLPVSLGLWGIFLLQDS